MQPFIKEFNVQCKGPFEEVNYPGDFQCFSIRLELEIGIDKLVGSDTFTINVCDKEGFKKDIGKYFESEFEKNNKTQYRYVEKTLVINKFNKAEIKNKLNKFVESCKGDTIKEVYLKIEKNLEYNP